MKSHVKNLLIKLEFYSDADDANEFYMKAITLKELKKAKDDGEYGGDIDVSNTTILDCLNKAVDLDSDEPMFVVERGNFYFEIDDHTNAQSDLQHALTMKIPEYNYVRKRHTQNLLESLEEKLNVSQRPVM